jgi:hypothetical protein
MGILNSDPAGDVSSVTPSDSADTAKPFRALRVSGAGNVKITTMANNQVTCAFLAGETRPVAGTRVWSTGTTATGIEAYH